MSEIGFRAVSAVSSESPIREENIYRDPVSGRSGDPLSGRMVVSRIYSGTGYNRPFFSVRPGDTDSKNNGQCVV